MNCMPATVHGHGMQRKTLPLPFRESIAVFTGETRTRRGFRFLLRGARTNNLVAIEIDDLPRFRTRAFDNFVRHRAFSMPRMP